MPDSPEAYAEIAAHSATKAAEATREAITETYYEDSLAIQVEKFTRYNRGGRKFDAIVRAKVTGHRYVEPNLDIEWPDEAGNPPFPSTTIDEKETHTSWRRIKLQIEETYLGTLPQGYELLTPEHETELLEIGKEYIIYVWRVYVAEDLFPDRTGILHYNEEQLEAFGGEGGLALLNNTWLIDGNTAWLLDDYIPISRHAPRSKTAQQEGTSLPVTDLIAAIKRGRSRPDQ